MASPNTKNFVWSGCICCYNSCEMDDVLIGCAGSETCLCITEDMCCGVPNESNPMKPIGLVKKDNYIFGLSLPCCECGIVKPTVLVDGSGQCLCMKGNASFPFGEKVPKPVCAFCGFKCLPGPPGCLQPYDAGSAATVPATMER